MSSSNSDAWVHIGECPVCVDGLCRVRFCCSQNGESHLLAVCDECEAIWVQPDTTTLRVFADATDARCPICNQPLYGPQSHWATEQEVNANRDWSLAAIIETDEPRDLEAVAAVPDNPDDLDLLSVEDIAADLDAPALIADPAPKAPEQWAQSTASTSADDAYGQDEPKPGC